MVRCWSMTEEDSMRGVLVRAKRKESKKERRRKEKRKKISFFFFFLFSFFWKDQNERPPLFFLQEEKRKKESSHSSKPKKEERKENHNKIYSSRASRNVEAASSAEKKTPTRRIHKARSSSVLMIGFYIARLRDFYCADRTRIFSLFVVFEGREENLSSRALSLSLVCMKTTQQKREEKRRNENEKKLIKKNIIKNVAARALRKTSVLSFRVHHARDIFVMNRWRSSVFFIWTRMYLYITVYPPLLFCLCFFSSSSSSCFFGTLAKEVFAFSIKKRERKRSFFLRFSSLSFLVLSGAFERDKKKRALFFLLLSDANKRTNANASLRLKSTTGGRVQKDDARLKKVLFLFCCVVLCSCFWSGCCFVSRGEREKGTTKKAKRKEKILSVQKIRVPLLLFSVPKTSRQRTTKGLQNKFWIVSKTFIAQL